MIERKSGNEEKPEETKRKGTESTRKTSFLDLNKKKAAIAITAFFASCSLITEGMLKEPNGTDADAEDTVDAKVEDRTDIPDIIDINDSNEPDWVEDVPEMVEEKPEIIEEDITENIEDTGEDLKTDDILVEDIIAEEDIIEDVSIEETVDIVEEEVEDVIVEDVPVEDVVEEDIETEDVIGEDVEVEDVTVEDVPVEDVPVEDVESEDVESEDVPADPTPDVEEDVADVVEEEIVAECNPYDDFTYRFVYQGEENKMTVGGVEVIYKGPDGEGNAVFDIACDGVVVRPNVVVVVAGDATVVEVPEHGFDISLIVGVADDTRAHVNANVDTSAY